MPGRLRDDGSTDLDWRSFPHNHELDAVVCPGAERCSSGDLAASGAITLASWQRRPPHLRVQEALARLREYGL